MPTKPTSFGIVVVKAGLAAVSVASTFRLAGSIHTGKPGWLCHTIGAGSGKLSAKRPTSPGGSSRTTVVTGCPMRGGLISSVAPGTAGPSGVAKESRSVSRYSSRPAKSPVALK